MLSFKQFILEQQILLENRIDFLKNQFKDKLSTKHDSLAQHQNSDDIVDHFAINADPTKNKAHTQWILNQYQQGNIRQEDHPRIKTALSNFEKYKPRLLNKDINKYKTLSDIEDVVQPHIGTVASNKEKVRQEKEDGSDLIHDENGFQVRHLKTKDAACHYGKGTKWCTAGTDNNMFDHYNKDGKIYFIKGRDASGNFKKYQFHPASNQFMDERDIPVNMGSFIRNNPEIRNVQEFKTSGHLAFDDRVSKKDIDKIIERHNTYSSIPPDEDDDYDYRDHNMAHVIHNPNFNTEHVIKLLEKYKGQYDNQGILKNLKDHPKVTPYIIDHVLNDDNYKDPIKKILISNPNATSEQIRKALGVNTLRSGAIANKSLSTEDFNNILHHGDAHDHEDLIKNPSLIKDHLHTIIDQYNGKTTDFNTGYTNKLKNNMFMENKHKLYQKILEHPEVDSSHISKILKDSMHDRRDSLGGNYGYGHETISKILSHPKLSDKDVDNLSGPNFKEYHSDLLFNNKLNEKHLHNIIDAQEPDQSDDTSNIMFHPAINSSHIHKIIDKNLINRHNIHKLIEHKSFDDSHIDKLINHPDADIRASVAQHKDLRPKHIDKLLDDPDATVASMAIAHNNASPENILKAIHNPNIRVRNAAMIKKHDDKHTPEHYESYLSDPDNGMFIKHTGDRQDSGRDRVRQNYVEKYPDHAINSKDDLTRMYAHGKKSFGNWVN